MTNLRLLMLAMASGDHDAVAKAFIDARGKMCSGPCPEQGFNEFRPCIGCAKQWLEQEAVEISERDTKTYFWCIRYEFSKRDLIQTQKEEEHNVKF